MGLAPAAQQAAVRVSRAVRTAETSQDATSQDIAQECGAEEIDAKAGEMHGELTKGSKSAL